MLPTGCHVRMPSGSASCGEQTHSNPPEKMMSEASAAADAIGASRNITPASQCSPMPDAIEPLLMPTPNARRS